LQTTGTTGTALLHQILPESGRQSIGNRSGIRIRPGNQVPVVTVEHSMSPRPKKARQERSNVKVMLIPFFNSRGVVHHEYAPQGQTVTKEYYRDVLRRLRYAVQRKKPELWSTGNCGLLHDNAPAHSSHLTQTSFRKTPDSCGLPSSLLS